MMLQKTRKQPNLKLDDEIGNSALKRRKKMLSKMQKRRKVNIYDGKYTADEEGNNTEPVDDDTKMDSDEDVRMTVEDMKMKKRGI